MILKLLLVIAVIGIVYFMFIKKKPIQNKTESKKNKNKKKEKLEANDMIECPTCGIYSELGECILSNGKYYCSSECASKAL